MVAIRLIFTSFAHLPAIKEQHRDIIIKLLLMYSRQMMKTHTGQNLVMKAFFLMQQILKSCRYELS